jgi:hypothetical protein
MVFVPPYLHTQLLQGALTMPYELAPIVHGELLRVSGILNPHDAYFSLQNTYIRGGTTLGYSMPTSTTYSKGSENHLQCNFRFAFEYSSIPYSDCPMRNIIRLLIDVYGETYAGEELPGFYSHKQAPFSSNPKRNRPNVASMVLRHCRFL